MTMREFERPMPLTRLRLWTDGASPDRERRLSDTAIVAEWAGHIGHPTSYGLLGLDRTTTGVVFSNTTAGMPYTDALPGGADEVTFDLGGRECDAVREILSAEPSRGWEVVIAASGVVGSSPMAFSLLAVFVQRLFDHPNIITDVPSVWAAWEEARSAVGRP